MDSEIRALLERHYKAWSTGDIEGVVACYTEDCVFEDFAMPARFEGHAGVRLFAEMAGQTIPDFKWEPHLYWSEGNEAGTEWNMTGLQIEDLPGLPATGKPFSVPGSSHMTIRDGLIAHNRDYWNRATYLHQD